MVEARRQYLRRLSQLRAAVRDTIRQQREAMFYRHPDPVRAGRTWASPGRAVPRAAAGAARRPGRPPAGSDQPGVEPAGAGGTRRVRSARPFAATRRRAASSGGADDLLGLSPLTRRVPDAEVFQPDPPGGPVLTRSAEKGYQPTEPVALPGTG